MAKISVTITVGLQIGMVSMRYPGLDSVRGAAALIVVLYHFTYRFRELYKIESPFYFDAGHVGVVVFFILSGVVMAHSVGQGAKDGSGLGVRDFSRFMFARFYRLYPVFFVCMILTFYVSNAFDLPGRTVEFRDALLNLTMIPRFLGARYVDGVYWSLEVEVVFYFLFGMLSFLLPGRVRVSVIVGWAILGLAAPYFSVNFIAKAIRVSLVLDWAPYFSFGVLLYWQLISRKTLIPLLVVGSVAIIALMQRYGVAEILVVVSGVAIIFLSIINNRSAYWGALSWLGAISYPLYLVHQNIGYGLMLWADGMGVNRSIGMVFALFIVIFISMIVHVCIEKPAIRYAGEFKRTRLGWN